MTTTYTNRSNAARAARKALGADKIAGVHFNVVDAGEGAFTWETPAQADSGPATPDAPAVKPKAAKAPRAPKASPQKGKTGGKIYDNGEGLPKGKLGTVVLLLQAKGGATIPAIQAATGWLPHTARAAINRDIKTKRGFAVTTRKSDAGLVYEIV